jgi:hypothetical protein
MATPGRGLELRTRVVTQTITRPSTTITTLVTLGGDGPTSTPEPPTPTPTPDPTTTSLAANPAPLGSTAPLTSEQLAALLGSLLTLTFLLLLLCCYLSVRRRRQALHEYERQFRRRERYAYDDDEDYDGPDGQLRGTAAWNMRAAAGGRGHGMTGTWTTLPPPVRFPPTPRVTGYYQQTREAQMDGVRRYP